MRRSRTHATTAPIGLRWAVLGALWFVMAGNGTAQPDAPSAEPRPVDATYRLHDDLSRVKGGRAARPQWLLNEIEAARITPRALIRYLLDPRFAWSGRHQPVATALARRDVGSLAPIFACPMGEVRDNTAIALVGSVSMFPFVTGPNQASFVKHGLDPNAPVGDFLHGLKSQDAAERVFCEAVLRVYRPAGRARNADRRKALVRALEDPDPEIRRGAALGLRGQIQQRDPAATEAAIAKLRPLLADRRSAVRAAAAEALFFDEDLPLTEAHAARVLAALEDDDPSVVATAASAYVPYGTRMRKKAPTIVERLCDVLPRWTEPWPRACLLSALAAFATEEPRARDAIRDALRNGVTDPAPAKNLLSRLSRSAFAPELLSDVLGLAARGGPTVRGMAAQRAAMILARGKSTDHREAVLRALRRAVADPLPAVREQALQGARVLARAEPVAVASILARGLADPEATVRRTACWSAAAVGVAAVPLAQRLIALAADAEMASGPRMGLEAIGAAALPALIASLEGPQTATHPLAISLVARLGAPALPHVRRLLESTSTRERLAALQVIRLMGAPAYPCESSLIGLARNGAPIERVLAAHALFVAGRGRPVSAELREAARADAWCAWAAVRLLRDAASAGDVREVAAAIRATTPTTLLPLIADAAALGRPPTDPAEQPASTDDTSAIDIDQADAAARRRGVQRLLAREKTDGIVDTVHEIYGVEITTPAAGVKRGYYSLPSIGGFYTPIQAEQRDAVVRRLALAMAHYGPGVLAAHIDRVVVVRSLLVRGHPYGGTYRHRTIYLACGARVGVDLDASFHHEFSSYLARQPSFPRAAWLALNEPDHTYGDGGRSAIRRGLTHVSTVRLLQRGFFKAYGMAALEEDVNVVAEFSATYPYWATQLASHFPRLEGKLALWRSVLAGRSGPR